MPSIVHCRADSTGTPVDGRVSAGDVGLGDGRPGECLLKFESAFEQGCFLVDVGGEVHVAPTDDGYATRLQVIVTTFTDDDLILEARDYLEAVADDLAAAPGSNALSVGVSGEVIASQESLAAFTRAMVLSLSVALLLTTLIVGWALRSIRFSVVSLVPILVVVITVWGYTALRGFTINVVTATIAAIAVGVGIDFCTHFTVRYRDELAVDDDPLAAVRRTAAGACGGRKLGRGALTWGNSPLKLLRASTIRIWWGVG